MSRGKVRGTQRKSRPVEVAELALLNPRKIPKFHRFIGVSLGGGKTDKTCLSTLEYYPDQKKIFLSRLFDKIRTEGEVSADAQIIRLIRQNPPPVESVTFDVPLQLPKCLICPHKCPGYEECE